MEISRPKVGMGIYIMDGKGNALMMLRKAAHAGGTWAPPGGHFEMGEEFLDCVQREVKEEVGLDVKGAQFLAVVNNIFSPEKHYVNVDFVATGVVGTITNMEPEKAEKIEWHAIDKLPSPLMLSVSNLFKEHPEIIEKLRTFNSFE